MSTTSGTLVYRLRLTKEPRSPYRECYSSQNTPNARFKHWSNGLAVRGITAEQAQNRLQNLPPKFKGKTMGYPVYKKSPEYFPETVEDCSLLHGERHIVVLNVWLFTHVVHSSRSAGKVDDHTTSSSNDNSPRVSRAKLR